MTTEAKWVDDLIWCPSQCYYPLTRGDGSAATLYLRWRHDDPWTAAIIGGHYPKLNIDDWTDIEIPYFRDDQLFMILDPKR